jgi:hypothetical protein
MLGKVYLSQYMNKRPGHVKVTTEVGYCSFCTRSRTLRREEHQLGTFVRTIVSCESCHRTLSSTMGVASAEAPASEPAAVGAEASDGAAPTRAAVAAKPAAKRKPAAAKTTAASTKPKATKARTTKSR